MRLRHKNKVVILDGNNAYIRLLKTTFYDQFVIFTPCTAFDRRGLKASAMFRLGINEEMANTLAR